MKIRIKVKQLVLFVLLPLTLLILLPGVLQQAAAPSVQPATSATADTGAKARQELLNTLNSSTGSKRMTLIRTRIIEPGNARPPYQYNVYIGSSSSQWSQNNNEEPPSLLLPGDKLRFLREYMLEGPIDRYLLTAAKQLVYEYDVLGTGSDGDKVLTEAIARISSKSSLARELLLLQAQRALSAGNWAAAKVLLVQADSPGHYGEEESDARSAWLSARLLFAEGDSSGALKLINNGLENYQEVRDRKYQEMNDGSGGDSQDSKDFQGSTGDSASAPESFTAASQFLEEPHSESERQLLLMQNALLSAAEAGNSAPATLSGTLTYSDGTPVSRAGIFLRPESEVNHSVLYGSEPYEIVTDAQGRFSFSGVIPGYYQLFLGLSFEQIDGWTWPVQADDWIEINPNDRLTHNIDLQPLLELKSPVNSQILTGDSVEFEWETVRNAASYSLSGTVSAECSTFSYVIRQHITGNKISIPVTELYSSGGFSTSSSGEGWESVEPSSLLGFADPSGRFSWSIEAYDESGRVITRSNGYRLNEDTVGNLPFFYLQSRSLTAADQLVKAQKLEQSLEAYRHDYAGDPQDDHALKMLVHLMTAKASYTKDKSLEAATIPLLVKLVELRPTADYVFNLAHYYYEQSDWKSYNHYYSWFLELRDQKPHSYDQGINATALMYQGKLDEARRQFVASLEEDGSHRFTGSYLAAELAAGQPLDAVLKLAQRYPQHSPGSSPVNWAKLITLMKAERTGQPELFDRELEQMLKLYTARSGKLREWTRESGDSALKTFMKAVLEVD
ncbi:carboxypeptidase-like regulatory domain-containing protein [Paenibacillus phytohabitans]|uniref:carboxypeptidase-like regulatory domain-containing protein n=1 Tax=Paenibacillus phytohabitans TaxID=2654978 RepID=UPI00300BC220